MTKTTPLTRRLVLASIRAYQKTLSLDHGPLRRFFPNGYCRFYPTCSEYGFTAVKTYGVVRCGFMALGRIGRCHPWHPGGYDPVA